MGKPNEPASRRGCAVTAPTLSGLLDLASLKRTQAEDRVDYRYEDYAEEDGRIHVRTQGAYFDVELKPWLSLKGNYIHDAISGATPTGAPPLPGQSTVAMTTMDEIRNAGYLEPTFRIRNHSVLPQFAYSTESDYESVGISLNDAIDLNEKHVSPWERGALADPAMRAERDPLGLLRAEHMWFSREAAYGGCSVGGFAGLGVLATLGLILLGGLALNLTPCVLPMIPINLAILGAGRENRDRRRSIVLGGAYGAGMALAYGGLGLVVVLTGSTFGALNSSPWFNFAIAVVFVVLGLAKLGYVPRFCNRHITHMLAEGVALTCEIARVDPNSPPWEAVAVRIWPVAVDSAFDAESANRHFGPE